MGKRISADAKINAYNDAIAALENQESDSDTADDKAARQWLADKLDRECQRWMKSLRAFASTKGQP